MTSISNRILTRKLTVSASKCNDHDLSVSLFYQLLNMHPGLRPAETQVSASFIDFSVMQGSCFDLSLSFNFDSLVVALAHQPDRDSRQSSRRFDAVERIHKRDISQPVPAPVLFDLGVPIFQP